MRAAAKEGSSQGGQQPGRAAAKEGGSQGGRQPRRAAANGEVINGEVKVPAQVEGGDQGEEKYFERARAVAMASLGIT